MTNQLLNVLPENILSEVAINCGDRFYRDFSKKIYLQAIYRAMRSIAIQYQVIERVYVYNVAAEFVDPEKEMPITRLNFTSNELKFMVNDIEYTEKKEYFDGIQTDENQFYIRHAESLYYFNYGNKALNDVVKILYPAHISGPQDYETTLPESSEQNIAPILPDKFNEEIIRRATVHMGKLGTISFTGEKREKWINVYRMNGGQKPSKTVDTDLVEDQDWIIMKPNNFLDM